MPTTVLTPLAFRSTGIGTPTHWAGAVGLLLAGVLLVIFGSVASGIVHRAGLARSAEVMAQHDRMGCEQHVLAITRRDCKLALLTNSLSR